MKNLRWIAAALTLGVALTTRSSRLWADEPQGTGVQFAAIEGSVDAALGKAKTEKRSAALFFTEEFCGPCEAMEAEALRTEQAARTTAGVLCLKLDLSRDSDRDVAKRFQVEEAPVVIWLGPDGAEVDRIIGFGEAGSFLARLQEIREGKNTIPALRTALAAAPTDSEVLLALGERLARADPPAAVSLMDRYLAKEQGVTAAANRAFLIKAEAAARSGNATAWSESLRLVAERFSQTDETQGFLIPSVAPMETRAPTALLAFVEAYRQRFSPDVQYALLDMAVGAHVRGVRGALKAQAQIAGEDAAKLENIASNGLALGAVGPELLALAQRAVKLDSKSARALDTLARVQFRMGRLDEAIATEERALAAGGSPALLRDIAEQLAQMRAVREHRQKQPGR